MNFFESQDIARRNTKLLLVLFALAVLSLIALTNVMVFVFINFQDSARVATGMYYYSWETFALISVAVIGLVILASLYRMQTLKGGGQSVAEMLDGELLADHRGDLNKRKLLNVVEEMAIASGTPVPPVYLIRDSAINAFAAGYSPGDAVIGVTYGAMENLSRDELQGVIAHEFSHILNGDMRLNIRLIGVLYGILMMAIVGRILLHSGAHRTSSRSKSNGSIAAFGLGLVVIGYLGKFFGSLIKAAVSRQREFLADASAVQFTRNPDGIAGALKRIGGFTSGSVLQHPESEELSHTFFSQGVKVSLAGMMATHPPLEKRILRIQPGWDGSYDLAQSAPEGAPAQAGHSDGAPEGAMGFAGSVSLNADNVIDQVGNPALSQLENAQQTIAGLPATFVEAAHDPYSARALIYLLQLDPEDEIRGRQLAHLEEAADFGVFDALKGFLLIEAQLTPTMKIPLLEMSLPTLRQLSYEQYKLFQGNLDVLIKADGRIGLSEWAVQKIVRKHLGSAFEGIHSKPRFSKLGAVKQHCEILLSMLAYSDAQSGVSPEAAFEAGRAQLDLDISLQPKSSLSFGKLNNAIDTLADLQPLRKPKLLKACVQTITADQKISVVEHELVRAVADTLECPLPPLSISGS
jgi:Zn-dependent protease with chaperone function/uncharacterized tellurite resistance protein B-like protein